MLLMLDSEIATFPQPKEPRLYTKKSIVSGIVTVMNRRERCTNEVNATLLEGH